VYTIRPDAAWSDGEPVVAEDFVYTHSVMTGLLAPIDHVAALSDKTVLVVFEEVFGAWRSLFDYILPAHIEDPSVSGDALQVTAGPFVLDNWLTGESLTLRRNPNHGSEGDVDEVTFVFQESVRSAVRALDRNEIDVLSLKPLDWLVADVARMDDVVYETGPGAFWEHIDFNLDDPLLSQRWVREAIATAVPRDSIMDATVRTVDPESNALAATVWMSNASPYEPHFMISSDPEAAEKILTDRFCVKGDDGIYSCQGRRMSFVFAYAIGDPYRAEVFEIVSGALSDIGIELLELSLTPSELFSTDTFFAGPDVWQMMNFSWKASEEPSLANGIYLCDGDTPSGFGSLNVTRYCDEEVDALIANANSTPDDVERAALYNDMDSIYLGDLASIPLYQKPEFLAWSSALAGPVLNMSSSSDLWNLESWVGKQTIVISIEEEPVSLDPRTAPSRSESLVRSALFGGAFSARPDLTYEFDLIESTELILGEGP